MTESDLAAPAVELRCGKIDEDGWLYVNGKQIGESHDWQVPAVFDLKPFLHPGENTLAIAVANWGGAGGLNKGVTLNFRTRPWRRNGSAACSTVSRKSSSKPRRNPATIKLTASADGLAPAAVSVQSQPCTPRAGGAVKNCWRGGGVL